MIHRLSYTCATSGATNMKHNMYFLIKKLLRPCTVFSNSHVHFLKSLKKLCYTVLFINYLHLYILLRAFQTLKRFFSHFIWACNELLALNVLQTSSQFFLGLVQRWKAGMMIDNDFRTGENKKHWLASHNPSTLSPLRLTQHFNVNNYNKVSTERLRVEMIQLRTVTAQTTSF